MDETKTQAAAEVLTRQIQIKDVHYISDANICIQREKTEGCSCNTSIELP